MRPRLLAGLVAALCLLAVGIAAPASAQVACSTDGSAPTDVAPGTTPVVYVHGWNSSADAAGIVAGADALQAALGGQYSVVRFDYGAANQLWPDGDTARCLAEYLVRARDAAGAGRRVVVVAHSMGGLATRFAAARTVGGVAAGSVLAGLVTLGTPHQGSPWGGTPYAAALAGSLPVSGSAADCLAGPSRTAERTCARPPYLPDGVRVHQIGTQITVERTLFGFSAIGGTAEIPLYGDGVVPQDSALGYPNSVPRVRTPSTRIGADTVPCSYDTDYLGAARLGAKIGGRGGNPVGAIIGGELGILANIWLDDAALRDMQAGRASPALTQLTLATRDTPCFHTNLPTESRVVGDAANAIRAMDTGPAQATRVVNLTPVVGDGPARGWTVTDEPDPVVDCGQPSGSAVAAGIHACAPSSSYAVACWPLPEGYVLCLRDPWNRTLVRMPANNTEVPVTPVPDPSPLGITLDDGRRCFVRDGGSWSGYDGDPELVGAYACGSATDETYVWATPEQTFDRSGPAWTVRVGGTSGPLQTRTVTEAYFAA